MKYYYCMVALVCLFLTSCAAPPVMQDPAYTFKPPTREMDYLADVEPVLVKRCVVCHSCYNSPCQLKLSSWDGFDRGASKEKIYNAARLQTMDPSRLLVDAHSTKEWRDKGFFKVKQDELQPYEDSMIYMLLNHKRLSPDVKGEYYPEADDLTCAETTSELEKYLEKHPNNGMPFGFPPLSNDEFNTVVGWLTQGAKGPNPTQQVALETPKDPDQVMVEKWEYFLNIKDPKHQVTARYVYEHLFLAHLTFETNTNEFYEIVRSRTAPGVPIDIIATVRPYDDPKIDEFYYRFRKIYSTIVYKTHMVFPFGDEQYNRINELFLKPVWLEKPHMLGYDAQQSANPFEVYEQIPIGSRYQWLLDNAHYVIKTFIRGPVCKGQIALNVVNDHFWVMFMDPEHDLSIKYPGFLKLHKEKLRMPAEDGSDYKLYSALLNNDHYKWAVEYYKEQQEFYSVHYPDGLNVNAIWKGERPQDQPLLTVFRHFDSASVHRGALGSLPKTMWVVDYPLLERIYYSLVAGFDIYGTGGHQLATRLYMDALRVEGESNFLNFMPSEKRLEMMKSWYIGVDEEDIHYTPAAIPAGIKYVSEEPNREFIEKVVNNHISVEGISFDQNYLAADVNYPELPKEYHTIEDMIQGFVAVSAPGVSFFRHVGDHNANVAWVRVKDIPGKEDLVISVVVDRWHDNVKFLARERFFLDPGKDKAHFIKGFVGSYPNYFFVVDASDLPDFFEILNNYDNSPSYVQRLQKYGINRSEDNFWDVYDWFQEAFDKKEGEDAGLADLNRYFHYAIDN